MERRTFLKIIPALAAIPVIGKLFAAPVVEPQSDAFMFLGRGEVWIFDAKHDPVKIGTTKNVSLTFCTARRRGGESCPHYALPGSARCRYHGTYAAHKREAVAICDARINELLGRTVIDDSTWAEIESMMALKARLLT